MGGSGLYLSQENYFGGSRQEARMEGILGAEESLEALDVSPGTGLLDPIHREGRFWLLWLSLQQPSS